MVTTGPDALQGLVGGALGPVGGALGLAGAAFGLAGHGLSWLQHVLLGTPLPTDSASLFVLLQSARASGQAPTQYKELLAAYWQAKALEHAGIDGTTWDPSRGVDADRGTVLKVYEYYRRLYQQDPDLEWAGLANLVGPGFAAAFLDLDKARDVARAVVKAGVPASVVPPLEGVGEFADLSDDQLHFYESTFLQMQKDIFTDIVAMHEAYLNGPDGMANLQEMADAGIVKPPVLAAWQQIDGGSRTGAPELLHQGAVGLANWEQNYVIAPGWDAMREHHPAGSALTYLMTVVGRPSVPEPTSPGR